MAMYHRTEGGVHDISIHISVGKKISGSSETEQDRPVISQVRVELFSCFDMFLVERNKNV